MTPVNDSHPTRTAEEIQRELAELRSAIVADVRAVASDARTLADWRYHFRKHPWWCCAGAAALGFWIVPRRSGAPNVPAQSSSGLVDRVLAQASGAEPPAEAGAAKGAVSGAAEMLAALALRQGVGFLASYGREWLERQALEMARAARANRENHNGTAPYQEENSHD